MFGIARAVCPGDDEDGGDGRAGKKDRTVVQGEEEAGGTGAEFVDEAHEGWAWSSTQAFRDGASGFMRQP
jgi:hypothetical protein